VVISPLQKRATIQSRFHNAEIEKMTYDNNQNLEINPSMILLGLGYATSLCVAIGWVATFIV
jgi:hypothetical protein